MKAELISINPATGQEINRYPTHTNEEISLLVDQAQATFQTWRKTSIETRIQFLDQLANLLQSEQEQAIIMTHEMGKPITSARAEWSKCATLCSYYAKHLKTFLTDECIAEENGKTITLSYQPLGPLLGIMPWNFPFWQVIRFAVPAIAAGNTVLLKHASNVSGSALLLEQLMLQAGLPKGVYQAILAKSDQMPNVIEHPCIQGVSLTGSTQAGAAVASLAGASIKPSLLELGGNDAYVILKDANLELAVREGLDSRMKNAGQSCIGAKRFIVEAPVYDAFVDLLIERMRMIDFGDPLDPTTVMGPLVSIKERDRIHQSVCQAIEQGATLISGGEIPVIAGAFYPPTLLTIADRNNIAFTEELFGPICTVIRAKNKTEAIDMANDSNFGLGAALFTENVELGHQIIREELEAGAVFLNEFVKSDPRIAFGGIKQSGYGREMGKEGIHAFVNKKYLKY